MAKKKEVTYFTKVRGLATVIWDPAKNRPLAEFDRQGLYGTTDPALVEQLKGMGYRVVTAEQIKQAGMLLPEDFEAMRNRNPGRGYTQEGEGLPATAAPAAQEGNAAALLNPELPTGPAGGGRTLVK